MKYRINISSAKRQIISIDEFILESGKITLLLGESGIGKTLISRAIFGLLPADELKIEINGLPYFEYLNSKHCRAIRQNAFFVFQEPSSHLNPMRTLLEQLNEGDIRDASHNREIIDALFPAFSKTEREQLLSVFPKPYRPSGGEKQRILIAMAFKKMALLRKSDLKDPVLFVFDEPTGNLDNFYRNLFLKMLLAAQKRLHFTALLITHDYSMISEITANYPGMVTSISFSELRRKNHELIQEEFSTDTYLNWLESLSIKQNDQTRNVSPVLTMEPDIKIFDRSLTITTDARHKNRAALQIFPGDAVYLKAGSGVGKTTVAKIMMGLQKADAFQMRIGNLALNEKSRQRFWKKNLWAKKLSMVFQHADEALNLNGKVKDIFRGLPLAGRSDRNFLINNLKIVFSDNLEQGFLDRPVALLSGGQKQRLNLIRALILDTDILILDEPFNGLDFFTLQKVLDLIRIRQRQGKSFLLISHNEEIIDHLVPSNRIYYLNNVFIF